MEIPQIVSPYVTQIWTELPALNGCALNRLRQY